MFPGLHLLDAVPPIARSPRVIGHKAFNLTRLIAAGHAVPTGLIVTAQLLFDLRLNARLARTVVDEILQRIQFPLIVRSSAIAEDSAQFSFAGQYDTFVDLRSYDDLLHALLRCDFRATPYHSRVAIADHTMGAIVQSFAHTAVSGVLFSRDPLQPDDHTICIEVSHLFGRSLLRERFATVLLRIGRSGPLEPASMFPVLPPAVVSGLQRVALGAEEIIGSPADVEWGLSPSGHLWLFQVRPMTGLHPALAPSPFAGSERAIATGFPASRGTAVGHVALSVSDTGMAGTILLLDDDDSEALRAIPLSVGVLARTGSYLSHAAILARECNIPMLLNVEPFVGLCGRIGIDGFAGTVIRLE